MPLVDNEGVDVVKVRRDRRIVSTQQVNKRALTQRGRINAWREADVECSYLTGMLQSKIMNSKVV